jgi:transposase
MPDDTIGMDISKATLDIHRLSDGKMMSFSNCPAGFKALSKFCAQTTVRGGRGNSDHLLRLIPVV